VVMVISPSQVLRSVSSTSVSVLRKVLALTHAKDDTLTNQERSKRLAHPRRALPHRDTHRSYTNQHQQPLLPGTTLVLTHEHWQAKVKSPCEVVREGRTQERARDGEAADPRVV
jgi:hypothetical protein